MMYHDFILPEFCKSCLFLLFFQFKKLLLIFLSAIKGIVFQIIILHHFLTIFTIWINILNRTVFFHKSPLAGTNRYILMQIKNRLVISC